VSGNEEITYALDFRARGPGHEKNKILSSDNQRSDSEPAGRAIPRIARLMARAIRFDGLLRDERFRDYAEIARLGRVTRARITQIMKLLNLAPDIQEHILFLPGMKGLNERNLRPNRQTHRLGRAAAHLSEVHLRPARRRDDGGLQCAFLMRFIDQNGFLLPFVGVFVNRDDFGGRRLQLNTPGGNIDRVSATTNGHNQPVS
jgi:hypothetical protein